MKNLFSKIFLVLLVFSTVLPASSRDSKIYERPEEFTGNYDSRANAICLTDEGLLYIAGYETEKEEGRNILMQVNKGFSNPDWSKHYSGEEKKDDEGNGIAVDFEKSVIVAGYETVKGPKKNILINKWDKNGFTVWTKSIGTEYIADSEANGVAADAAGNIYVVGFMSNNNKAPQGWIIKLDKTGKELWQNLYAGGEGEKSEIKAVTLDTEGKIYVCGYKNIKGKPAEAFVQKLDADGKELLRIAAQAESKKEIVFNALALDTAGNIYTAGYQEVLLNGKDVLVKKFDKNGKELKEITFSGSARMDDAANGIAVDSDKNIYICGYTTGEKTRQDGLMIKYSPAGKEVMKRVQDNYGKNDVYNAICLDADGNIFLAGFAGIDSKDTGLWIKQYSQ